MHDNLQSKVLARKWRPQTFASTIGQDIVLKALEHALDNNRLHHAYLFTGTRGVGKTTISRLLAKALSCETGISSKPCNICNNCMALQHGQYIDYIELDAASNRGVEEISQLLDNACYQPSQGRFKIFMIDEVHMLSNHAFNAMLKTLEEPPPHVKFILATTDAHKIPLTVLSRCLQFHLKPLSIPNINQHLANILTKENVSFEIEALKYIAKAAAGSMRDALSITDQAIALSNSNLTVDIIQSMLGLTDESLALHILENIYHNNVEKVINLSQEIEQAENFLDNLLQIVQQIAILQALSNQPDKDTDTTEIYNLANLIEAQTLQIYYQMIIKAKQELSYCSAHICLNMLFLRMMNFNMPIDTNITINIQPNDNIAPSQKPNKSISSYKNIPIENIDMSISTNTNINNNLDISINDVAAHKIINNNTDNLHIPIDIIQPSIQEQLKEKIEVKSIPSISTFEEVKSNTQLNNITINNPEPDYNSSLVLKNINHEQWINLLPQLQLSGLSLEIIKQTIFDKYDEKLNTLYVSCTFDTNMMKSAVNKIEQAIQKYFSSAVKLSYTTNPIYQKSNIDKNAIHNNYELTTLRQQEKKQEQDKLSLQQQYIQQDEWIQSFVKIGAKIEII